MQTSAPSPRRAPNRAATSQWPDRLRFGIEIARHHHEKWDGKGYPDGLAGEAIPLSARLMAVADVYDALISRRIYKESMSHAEAVAIILAGSGTEFDPDIVAAFERQAEDFRAIQERYADDDADMQKALERQLTALPAERIELK